MEAVSIRLAGPFAVEHGAGRVGSRKARRLLMLLAVERERMVPVDRIVEVLWADAPPRKPVENVATLVSRLRGALGAEVVVGDRGGYRIGATPTVRIDVDEAARLVETARSRLGTAEPALAAVAAERALVVLGAGDVLTGEPDADWVAGARAAGATLLRAARHTAATAATATGDVATAITVATAAVATDGLDEPACRLLMAAHAAAGEPTAALAVYATLRSVLATELGVDPDPRTRQAHEAVLRELPAAAESTAPPRSAAPGRTPPAGRDRELARLDRAWADAVEGRSAVVLVVGEAGIGKTRLVEEAAAHVAAGGGRVLQARCYAAERSLFLQPLVDALGPALAALPPGELRELAGARAADLVGLVPALSTVLGPPPAERGGTEVELRRAFDAVVVPLRELSHTRPLLLVLDDLQNAGLATVELLHYLARHLDGGRVLVLATVRAEEGAAALDALATQTTRIELGPLDEAAVRVLAAAAGQDDLAATILRRTRGHTLFVVETLHGLRAGDLAVPETLQTAVLARLRRAGPEIDELVRVGAVLGATVDPAVAAAMLDVPVPDAVRRCERAAAARLLVVAGRSYEFANDMVQEVLYATTPEPLRAAYHRRAADLLTGSPEAVGAHAAAVEDWPRAAEALLRAGEGALARYGMSDAEALLSGALRYAERAGTPALVAGAYLLRGRAREAASDYRRAAGDYRAALATARDAGDERTGMLALWALSGHASLAIDATMAECVEHLRAALVIAERLGDHEVEAGLLAWLTIMSSNNLGFDDALVHGERAVRAARVAGSDTALAVALDGLKNAYAYIGELALLEPVLAELEPLLRRTGHLELLQWTVFESALPAIAAADWATARRRVEDAMALTRRGGNPVNESWFVAHLGWIARMQGRHAEALDLGRQAVELAAPAAHRWFLTDADALLGATLVEVGETDEAARVLTAAHDRGGNGARAYLLRCLGPLVEIDGSPALLAEADQLLAGIGGRAWFTGLDAYCGVARAWLDRGDATRARAVLAPLLAEAERLRWLPMLAHAGVVDAAAAAALGDHDTARALLTRSAALGRTHGMPAVAEHAAARLRP